MAAKLTPGGTWLREQRRALGLTADALGGALGVAGNTIRAVECGARILSPQLRARAEAYISKNLLLEPARERRLPPDDRVRAVAWVNPRTLTAALRLAKKQGTDLELVLGGWADRLRADEKPGLERAIALALRSAIKEQGPITSKHVGSAAKRLVATLLKRELRADGAGTSRSRLRGATSDFALHSVPTRLLRAVEGAIGRAHQLRGGARRSGRRPGHSNAHGDHGARRRPGVG